MATRPASAARVPIGRELLLDGAIAVAVFGVSLALVAGGAGPHAGELDAASVLLTALTSLPLVARRYAPLGVFLLTAAASVALRAVVDFDGPPLGPTLALYWLSAGRDESGLGVRPTLALVAAMLVAHLTATGLHADRFPLAETLWGVVVWGGAWLAGDRTRLRRERMAELEERALRAERESERERRLAAAEERTRIARDLHDSAGHAINVILVHAGLGRIRSRNDPEGARAALETIEEVARETAGEIDQIVQVLRDDGSRAEAPGDVEPPPGLAALGALISRHRAAGLDVTATIRGDRRPLPPGLEQGAYRILQEALTNAARHGDGSAVVDAAYGEAALEISVSNPVRPGGDAAPAGGHGVIGMRERASLLGGSLETGARGGRFRLHARLPFAR
ncbi:MAG TPA: histidine kinase [Thermoleophilaceae bacterium]